MALDNEYSGENKARADVRQAASDAGMRVTSYTIQDKAGQRTTTVELAVRSDTRPAWVEGLRAALQEHDYEVPEGITVKLKATKDVSGQLEFRILPAGAPPTTPEPTG